MHKNATRDEVLYLGMVIRDRCLLNCDPSKRPTFWIHGHQFNYHDVQRSMRRWGLSLDSLGPTPPRPSHIQIIDPGTHQAQPTRPVTTPPELATFERILFQTDYMYGFSFDDTRRGSNDLKRCQRAFGWALQAVHEQDFQAARTHFDSALEHLKEALRQGSGHLLPLIYFCTVQSHAEVSDPARSFLQVFRRLASDLVHEYYREQHPFAVTLVELDHTQSAGEICVVALRKSLDLLYTSCQGYTETIEEVEIILIDTLRLAGEKTKALSTSYKVVRHREKIYPGFDPKILSAYVNLVNCYFRYGDFEDGEKILASIIGGDEDGWVSWPRVCQYFELLRLRALVVDAQGRHQETEKLVRHAIQELLSQTVDLGNAETILQSIARMMSDLNSLAKAQWIRSWIPRVKDWTIQQALGQTRECLNSIVAEYFMLVSVRKVEE